MNRLVPLLTELDLLLRGETTRPEALQNDTLNVSARRLSIVVILLAVLYGLCMGSFSLLKTPAPGLDDPYGPYLQVFASMLKTPALFFLTLVVTLPSLYVFNALVGSRLSLVGLIRLLVASLAVNLAVLASFGLIVAFFSLTQSSYPFIVLLNVVAFAVAGALGLLFLLQTLHRLTSIGEWLTTAPAPEESPNETPSEVEAEEPAATEDDNEAPLDVGKEPEVRSALDMPPGQVLAKHTRLVFRCWIVLFGLVGAQMGWVLRPFIGNPALEFQWFRERQSNFFAAVLDAFLKLLTGG